MKKVLSIFLCGMILLCFQACDYNKQPTENTNQNEVNSNGSINNNTESTEGTNRTTTIFNTKNIKRITFYSYYGDGNGCDVPAEYLDEIITWLDSFEIDEEITDLLPPGIDTNHVEIEYSDGTVVKNGLDTANVDGITFYIKGDPAPECYKEILSKTSLN